MASRNPTSRPRKIAGQQRPATDPVDVEPEDVEPEDVDNEPPAPPAPPQQKRTGGGGGRRRTLALAAAIVVLLGIGIAEILYLNQDATATVSADRPVVTGELSHRAAVDAAATDVAAIFSTPWRHYDAHLVRVTTLMTRDMASRYRRTSGPVRDHVVSSRTDTTTRVAASGVVRASDDEVLDLLFLDQRTSTRGVPPAYAARRALVTMVRTDAGWLVDNVQTR